MNVKSLLVAAFVVLDLCLYCQVPITPIWIRTLPSSTHDPRLALDQQAARLHLAFKGDASDPHTHIRAFTTDGTDIPAPYSELVLGTLSPSFSMVDQPFRLLAASDTLYSVERLQRQNLDYHTIAYRAGSITIDSSSVFNMILDGYTNFPIDIHHDMSGVLIASPTILRSYSTAHWMLARISIPTTDRIAANEQRVYCGRTPELSTIDRQTMTPLAPLVVPSSGTATRTLMTLSGDVLHYASTNDNLTMDVGAVDTTGTLIWSTMIDLPQATALTGVVKDAWGNTWVSGSRTTPQSGVVLRFAADGSLSGNYTFGRTIQDMVCSGEQLFLCGWDAEQSSDIYLAAFGTDITTGTADVTSAEPPALFPNPASSTLLISGIAPEVERIQLVDATGRTLRTLNGPFGPKLNLSVAGFAPGAYFVRMDGGTGSSTLSFQVSR